MTFSVVPVPVVVDASVAVEFLEGNPTWIEAFGEWAERDRPLLAPAQFLAEVANGQLVGRHAAVDVVISRIERLVTTGIETADRGVAGLVEAIGLASRHGLTVYDALYLQLALDVEGELAT